MGVTASRDMAIVIDLAGLVAALRDIVLRAWATVVKPDFRDDVDRVGAATGSITESARRALVEICEWALIASGS